MPTDHAAMNVARGTTSDLFTRAKIQVDLPGFLASHGWRAVPGKDTLRHRFLAGPTGGCILVNRAASSGHWVWRDLTDHRQAGTIVDACERLLGLSRKQTYGVMRRALQDPPPSLPLAWGGTNDITVSAIAEYCPRPPRQLAPLGEQAVAYLIAARCLDPATVSAFSHRLRRNSHGHMVAPHNDAGDGEERGEGWRSFVGSREDGPGRGRSLWHARPHLAEEPLYLLVAESCIDAMSAWQMLDPETQSRTEIVSTAGGLSEAGQRKLSHLIGNIQRYSVPLYRTKIVLLDASDVGEKSTDARVGKFEQIAAYHGMKHQRLATPVGKDWNDAVAAARHSANSQFQSVASEPLDQDGPSTCSQENIGHENSTGTRTGAGRQRG